MRGWILIHWFESQIKLEYTNTSGQQTQPILLELETLLVDDEILIKYIDNVSLKNGDGTLFVQ